MSNFSEVTDVLLNDPIVADRMANLPYIFYYTSPKKDDTVPIDNTTDLSSFSLSSILYSDYEMTKIIGQLIVYSILCNNTAKNSPKLPFYISDSTYHIYDKDLDYGCFRGHTTMDAVLNTNGMPTSGNFKIPIIQSTKQYSYLVPKNNEQRVFDLSIDDKGIRTITIPIDGVFNAPEIIYKPFCNFRDMKSTYINDKNRLTQNYMLTGTLYSNINSQGECDGPIGNLLSLMNTSVSNEISKEGECFTTNKDFNVRCVYAINDVVSNVNGLIVGIIIQNNANFNKDGSVYSLYPTLKSVTTTVSSGALVAFGSGDYAYLSPSNAEGQPYIIAIDYSNGNRTLKVPERIINSDGTSTLQKNEMFVIALNAYWLSDTDKYLSYIINVINNMKFVVSNSEKVIKTILRLTMYISRQFNAQYYIDPQNINAKNPFYSILNQKSDETSNNKNYVFNNSQKVQDCVVYKTLVNCEGAEVADALVCRHIYSANNTNLVIIQNNIHLNENYWLDLISGDLADITSNSDRIDGIYLNTVLSKKGFKSNFTAYVVIKNQRSSLIFNSEFDLDTPEEQVVIAGEEPISSIPSGNGFIPDMDDNYHYLYYKINKPSSTNIKLSDAEGFVHLDLFSEMDKQNNLSNKIGAINYHSTIISTEIEAYNYLSYSSAIFISKSSNKIPCGHIQTGLSIPIVTSNSRVIALDGTFNLEILNSSGEYNYLTNGNNSENKCELIIRNNLRVLKIPKNKNSSSVDNIVYNPVGYFDHQLVTYNTYEAPDTKKLVLQQYPLYSMKTTKHCSINLLDIVDTMSQFSFINTNDITNMYDIASTYGLRDPCGGLIIIQFINSIPLTKDGTFSNSTNNPVIAPFVIVYATDNYSYLINTQKIVKGQFIINKTYTEICIPTVNSVPQIIPTMIAKQPSFYGSVAKSTIDDRVTLLKQYILQRNLYENKEDADNDNVSKSIGKIWSLARSVIPTTNTIRSIFFASFYFNKTNTFIRTAFSTDANIEYNGVSENVNMSWNITTFQNYTQNKQPISLDVVQNKNGTAEFTINEV